MPDDHTRRAAPSFDEFYRESFKPLLRHVMKHGARLGEAEDVVQEVMLQVLNNWVRLTNPLAWARRAATHQLIKHREREARLLQTVTHMGVLERVGQTQPVGSADLDEGSVVRTALAALPPAQRQVMAYHLDGYKHIEIADLLGKTQEAVRANLREARRKLRQLLPPKPYGIADIEHDHK